MIYEIVFDFRGRLFAVPTLQLPFGATGWVMLALQASRKRYANQFARKRWLRPGTVIWPTTVSADPGGMGAFAPAGGLGRGKFIGMYCADSWWRAPTMTPYRGRNKYVMQAGDFRCGQRDACEEQHRPGFVRAVPCFASSIAVCSRNF